jgi:hypothetical protein
VGHYALVRRARCVVVLALLGGALAGPALGAGHGIVWGGRTFSNPFAFRDWLSARGQTYARWAARHPAGLAVLERTPVAGPLGPGNPIRAVKSSSRAWPGWVSAALVALAAVLCLGGLFPGRILEERGLVYLLPARFGLLVAGVAVLGVVAIVSVFS